ncbi:Mannose-P-dolichol utilization defect 1 protein-like protein [Golovinomyces cichoracearum]|uniref:Mannose-P-dolichol utilization defect 1 protein homolog n=1 Tax=Golovinomyces cichoracearum TaxID=62708 RepID=A0A420IT80_9PEZI|nr:Mannose-P-dolichol utilization defect 1 protein-like protein [Golovinomyces cichoracearum]
MELLRKLIQPVTHNLPKPIRDFGISILGEKCFERLLLQVDFLSSPTCTSMAISKAVGSGIIVASSIVKIPQIIKIVHSHSASGLSFSSCFFESASYLFSLAYCIRQRFPFNAYGETALILIQNIIIACLILHFNERNSAAALFVAGLATIAYVLFEPTVIDIKALSYFQAASGALSVGSKIPQIITIWRQGGTGQLSAFSVFNFLLGSLARVFTTLQEVDDELILYGYIAGFALNTIITMQMIYYWNSPIRKSKERESEQNDLNSASSSSVSKASVRASSHRRRG